MLRALVLGACAASLAGCVTARVELDSQIGDEPVWQATLEPSPGARLHGSASVVALTPREDPSPRSRVTVAIAGAADGASHVWHVHLGACGSDGPIVGRSRAYTAIPVAGAGEARLVAEMPFVLDRRADYFVHVHESQGRGVEACGALLPVLNGVLARR